jgi:hypothetical protein
MDIVLDYARRSDLAMPLSEQVARSIAEVKVEKAKWVDGGGPKSAMSDFLDAYEDAHASAQASAGAVDPIAGRA